MKSYIKLRILFGILGVQLTLATDCHFCLNGLYDEDCLTESVTCQENQICMTEFRQENGQVRISKGCKQQEACDVQAQSNRTLCYEYPYVRVCHTCCEGEFCNTDMALPPFRNEGQCGKPAIRPILGDGSLLRKFTIFGGKRRFRRAAPANLLKYSPVSSWGYTVTDIGIGLDLLEVIEEEDSEDALARKEKLELEAMLEQMSPVQMKIAGGRPSVPGSWAWVAQIKYWRNGRYEFVCAGTLIADRWILTAAQCLSDEESGDYDVNNMVVVLGVHTLRGGDEKDRRQIYDVLQYQIHPNHRIDTSPRNDVALLLLNEQVEYTGFVHPACLPYGRYTSEYSDREADTGMVEDIDYCWFVGWGFTNAIPNYDQVKPNDLARVLQQSRHYLMDHDTCDNVLDTWNIDKKEHLCAVGYEKAPGFIGHACEGDGGGPLVCRHKDNSWFIAGIEIGQSSHCGQAPYERMPSVFSRVSVFENWINKVIYSPVPVVSTVKKNTTMIYSQL